MENDNTESLKSDVKDLLNQIVIKLKELNYEIPEVENHNYIMVPDEDSELYNKDKVFLVSVRNYCERVLKNEWEASRNEVQYYTSNC